MNSPICFNLRHLFWNQNDTKQEQNLCHTYISYFIYSNIWLVLTLWHSSRKRRAENCCNYEAKSNRLRSSGGLRRVGRAQTVAISSNSGWVR